MPIYANLFRCIGSLVTLAAFLLSSGCDQKPHEVKLPRDGRLTVAEVNSIEGKLVDLERPVFRRWAERMTKGEMFGGEPIAPTVREALLNQQAFEAQQAELAANEQARTQALAKERDEQISAAQQRKDSIYAHRQAVHTEIRRFIDATIPTYRPQTVYDRYDRPVSGFIEFNLKLTNRAPRAAIGIAGFVTIKDVFGRDLGSYPFALEPKIGSGQTIYYTALLNFDGRNKQHEVLWRTKNITSEWFFESVAFEDGTRIDSESVSRGSQSYSPVKTSGKAPHT